MADRDSDGDDDLPVDITKLTRSGMIDVINHLMRGRKRKGDADRARKEADDKADLHSDHKGRGPAPHVTRDDVPFGPEEEDEDEDDKDESCDDGECDPPAKKGKR